MIYPQLRVQPSLSAPNVGKWIFLGVANVDPALSNGNVPIAVLRDLRWETL